MEKMQSFRFRLDAALLAKLREERQRTGVPTSEMVRRLIEQYFAEQEQERKKP